MPRGFTDSKGNSGQIDQRITEPRERASPSRGRLWYRIKACLFDLHIDIESHTITIRMARIVGVHLCELAFLDNCDRLCLIGVTTRLPVPTLPVAVNQLMIAARVLDRRPDETMNFAFSLTTPSGLSTVPDPPDGIDVHIFAEYVLVTLRQIPITEEGIYRFTMSLGHHEPFEIDVPVLRVSQPAYAEIH